jgi:hypothetical protein
MIKMNTIKSEVHRIFYLEIENVNCIFALK